MHAKLFSAAMTIAAVALLAIFAFSHVGLFAVLELKGLDLLFILRGVKPPSEQVVVVAVDEPSFAELGLQWPWPRSLHGQLVRQLTAAGAEVVGMDILFAESSKPKEDESFAEALREVGNVVLASEHAVVNDRLFRHSLRADPIPLFREAAAGVGIPLVLLDADGTVRRTWLELPETSSFALSVAKEYMARKKTDRSLPILFNTTSGEAAQNKVLIDHLGPPRSVATASYYQALDYERLLPPGFFAGKVVLVGRSLVAIPEPQQLLGDTFLTPFSWLGLGPTSGVEIQATIVSNLLEGRFPVELNGVARILFLLAFLAVASLLIIRLKPVAGLLATAILTGVLLVLAYFVFLGVGVVLPVVAAIAGLSLVYGGHLMLRTVRAERSSRQALEEANRRLESKVAARTRQLSDAHQKLAKRHTDLESAYRDLARTQEQLIQSEKMASLGLLVAGVAHELNNPISYVSGNLDFVGDYIEQLVTIAESNGELGNANDEFTHPERQQKRIERLDATRKTLQELIASCKEGTERVKKIVLDLHTFSRIDDVGRVPADLHAGIESTLNLLTKQYKDRIRVHRDYGDLPEVECYPGQINQVLMNLLQNAAQAISDEGDVWIVTRAEAGWVKVVVRDNGSGIAEKDLNKIFDPFFTTKPVGTGTGLGLSISYGIVKKHGGRIRVQSNLNKGTAFIIELPVCAVGGQHETT